MRILFIKANMFLDKMKTKDFSVLCRCCMEVGKIEIFENVFETLSLARLIETCTHTTISVGDNMPRKICQRCFNGLVTSYLFITKYLKVQESLTDFIQSRKTKNQDTNLINGTKLKIENILPDKQTELSLQFSTHDLEIDIARDIGFATHYESSDDDKPLSNVVKSPKCTKNENFCGEKIKGGNICLNNEKSLFECFKCPRTFDNAHFFTKHLNVFHKNIEKKTNELIGRKHKKYYCPKCNECFNFIKLLEKHCRDTQHPAPRRYQCETCSMKFLTKSCLKAHLRIHSKEKPHTCEVCSMKFSLSSNLQRHKRRHTGEKDFFCEICGRGFIQKHTLTIHMRLHNGETPYICQECGKGYRAKPLLTQHLKKHRGMETYYRQHYLKHGSLKVECGICKKLLTKSGLYTHMKVQHGDGLKKFLCNLCGKTYTSKKSLETHMNVHTRKITYNCDICNKSFSHNNYLKTHMRIHSGEKPHCCDTCGKTFTQRAHLDGHMRTHTGARPYICNYCNKSFALKGNLKVHVRIHTGETPHRCSICNKGFFDSSNKKKHESTVHEMYQNKVE